MILRETITQTHDYLMYFLNILAEHGVFQQLDEIKIWSDGCSKHFKTYTTHYYMATLQEKCEVTFSWHFLPPNDAHNRADAAAANFSGTIKSSIRSTFILRELGHLAFVSSEMKNWYLFLVKLICFI